MRMAQISVPGHHELNTKPDIKANPVALSPELILRSLLYILIMTKAQGGKSVLMVAASSKDPSAPTLVQLLVDHGADITHKDKTGRTVLDAAATSGNVAMVTLVQGLFKDVKVTIQHAQ